MNPARDINSVTSCVPNQFPCGSSYHSLNARLWQNVHATKGPPFCEKEMVFIKSHSIAKVPHYEMDQRASRVEEA
jgi:hypothetical protein